MSKECSKCHESKPLDEFYRRTSSPDGRRSECAACCREAHRRYAATNARRNRQRPRDETTTKRCTGCRRVKPLSRFHSDISTPDGHHSECAACRQRLRLSRAGRAGGKAPALTEVSTTAPVAVPALTVVPPPEEVPAGESWADIAHQAAALSVHAAGRALEAAQAGDDEAIALALASGRSHPGRARTLAAMDVLDVARHALSVTAAAAAA